MPTSFGRKKKRGKNSSSKKRSLKKKQYDPEIKQCGSAVKQAVKQARFSVTQCCKVTGESFLRLVKNITGIKRYCSYLTGQSFLRLVQRAAGIKIQCRNVTGQFFLRLVKNITGIKLQKIALLRLVKTVFPVLLGGSFIYAVLGFTGIGSYITQSIDQAMAETAFAETVSVLAAVLVLLVSFIPLISPLIGPGLFITLIVAILSGLLLASGHISPFIALPALFAIDVQIGNKFPSAFAMGETEPETLAAGVPEIYFTRLITLPAAVTAAYFFSFVVFK